MIPQHNINDGSSREFEEMPWGNEPASAKNKDAKTSEGQNINKISQEAIKNLPAAASSSPHAPIRLSQEGTQIKDALTDIQRRYAQTLKELIAVTKDTEELCDSADRHELPYDDELEKMIENSGKIAKLDETLQSQKLEYVKLSVKLAAITAAKNISPWLDYEFEKTPPDINKVKERLKAFIPPGLQEMIPPAASTKSPGYLTLERIRVAFEGNAEEAKEEKNENVNVNAAELRTQLNDDIHQYNLDPEHSALSQDIRALTETLSKEGKLSPDYQFSPQELSDLKDRLDPLDTRLGVLTAPLVGLEQRIKKYDSIGVVELDERPTGVGEKHRALETLYRLVARPKVIEKEQELMSNFQALNRDYQTLWEEMSSKPKFSEADIADFSSKLLVLNNRYEDLVDLSREVRDLREMSELTYMPARVDLKIPIKDEVEARLYEALEKESMVGPPKVVRRSNTEQPPEEFNLERQKLMIATNFAAFEERYLKIKKDFKKLLALDDKIRKIPEPIESPEGKQLKIDFEKLKAQVRSDLSFLVKCRASNDKLIIDAKKHNVVLPENPEMDHMIRYVMDRYNVF